MLEKGQAEGEVSGVVPVVNLLIALLFIMGLPQSSPYLRTFLHSQPSSALKWSAFIINCVILKLSEPPHANRVYIDLPLKLLLDRALEYIVIGKPLSAEQGGDPQSCLRPADRKRLKDAIQAWMHGPHLPVMELDQKLQEKLSTLLLLVDDGVYLIAKARRYAYNAIKKVSFGKCTFCEESQADKTVCGDCRAFMYCSRRCQRADWPNHRICCFTADERLRGIDSTLFLNESNAEGDENVEGRCDVVLSRGNNPQAQVQHHDDDLCPPSAPLNPSDFYK